MLTAAVTDGGLTARSQVETVAREADDLFVTFPAYAALMAWGREGLNLIVEIAMWHHTAKSKSAALTLFSNAALDGKISAPPYASGMPQEFEALVNSKIDPTSMKSEASHSLRALVLSLPTDDLIIPVSQSIFHLTLRTEAIDVLVTALGVKWLRFGTP